MTRSVIDGDVCTHRMTDDRRGLAAQETDEHLEIFAKGTHLKLFGVLGVTVSPEIEGDHVEFVSQAWSDVIPPVGIRSAPMKHDELGLSRFSPGQEVKTR